MIAYCRAYEVTDVAESAEFAEAVAELPEAPDVVYIWADYTVTTVPLAGAGTVFGGDSEAWREFCRTRLGFSVPDFPAPGPVSGLATAATG